MRLWLKRILISALCLLMGSIVLVWLLLSSSILASARGHLTARMLTNVLGGQIVEIQGGVAIDLGSVLHVRAEDVVLPSQAMPQETLASIGQLDFDIDLMDLLKGHLDLLDLSVDQSKISLIVADDGTSSWHRTKQGSSDQGKTTTADLANILAGHRFGFTNTGVTYLDARNGLDLSLELATTALSQESRTAPVVLSGQGALNGEAFTLNGTFPKSDPYKLSMDFGQINVAVEGTLEAGDVTAGVTLDVVELGQLLDVLKLNKTVSGKGYVSATLKAGSEGTFITDLNVSAELDTGQSVEMTGDMGKLGDPTDMSIDTRIELYPDDNRPAAALQRRDLKLVAVDMKLMANPGGIPQRAMVIETNGFTLDTEGEGPPPISVAEISRTPDGLLRLGAVVLRIGPPEKHFLVLEASVEDVLQLDGVNGHAAVDLPAASLLAPEKFQTSAALGSITGGFTVKGNLEALGINDLDVASSETDLWHLKVDGSVKNALKFADIELNIAADVPSGAALLSALDLEPIDTGEVKLTTSIQSQGTSWQAKANIGVDTSSLDIHADLDLDDPESVVRGAIESDVIRVNHLRDIAAVAIQFGKLNKTEQAAEAQSEEEQSNDPPTPTGPIRNVTLQPLGQAILLSGMDMEIGIDLRKIEGDKGTTSLKSNFELKGDTARLGPVEFEYGGGFFNVSAEMDLEKNPDTISISGATGGWDFGKIMHAIKFKKGASGILNANFDVSGSHATVKDFVGTMNGSALVSMRNGTIDTQLLDLAGLGILPWLFTKDRGPTAPIICARMPLHVSNGQVSTKETVVETDHVQVVVYGHVDLKGKTLDIHGQPRRIGKPLSRSPWPFSLAGALAKPKVKVKDGPKRVRRKDGASTMPDKRKLCVPDILQLQ
nr:AsmA family protein [uncultured Shimia sp.]